jgi:hypothetical protein|nr:MAG TPA: LONG TAIL FIBER PROTEIN P37 PROTEIN, FIBER PROTEIN.2A [Caudoviricetes sp.]
MALVDFRYVRTGTGELSGPSMIHQTEQAFNELGTEIEDIRTDSGDALETAKDALEKAETATSAAASAQQTATEAVATANAAQATATEAVASANAAQETAQAANATAEQASTEAAAAKATAENALEKATGAEETSGNALSAAQSAQETASDALGTASTAQASADAAKKAAATAQTTADSAQSTAGQAFNLATALSSSRYFLEDSDTVDLDGLSSLTRLYLTGSVSITLVDGTKINAPFWFWNEFSTDGTHGLQCVCAEGKLCLREGTVSGGKMTWGSWKYVVPTATGGGRIPGEVVPFYNVNLGGEANRNPIFWGQSEPDTGWLICDGGSDGRGGSVPDLRNRFVMCSSYSGDAGQTGGATSVTPTVSVQNATQGGSIAISGTGIRVLDHTLGIEQIPSHNHTVGNSYLIGKVSANGYSLFNNTPGGEENNLMMANTGGTQPHTHGIYDAGHAHTFTGAAHTHAATANTINTLPPYYKMAYCVKLPE